MGTPQGMRGGKVSALGEQRERYREGYKYVEAEKHNVSRFQTDINMYGPIAVVCCCIRPFPVLFARYI